MVLRELARKLRVPATAALKQASSSPVSPAARSQSLTSHSPLNRRARRVANKHKFDDLDELERTIEKNFQEDKKTLEELSASIKNMPRNCVLTSVLGIGVLSSTWVYLCGDSSRKYAA